MELIGNRGCTKYLANAIERDRIAPAYLFYGLKGVGKFALAHHFAKTIAHESDITIFEPTYLEDGKLYSRAEAKAIGLEKKTQPIFRVEQVRELIKIAACRPIGNRNVIVVNDADHIQEDGANMLLKTLEEPGDKTTIILVWHLGQVLETIRSRCQVLDFFSLSTLDIKAISLSQNLEIDDDLMKFAFGSFGRYAEALEKRKSINPELVDRAITKPRELFDALWLAIDLAALPYDEQLWLMQYAQYRLGAMKEHLLLKSFDEAIARLHRGYNTKLIWENLYIGMLPSCQ